MSKLRYTPEFKEEAVRKGLKPGHSVAAVSERLGVSTYSLYAWIKAVKPGKDEQQNQELNDAKKEILQLRADLRRAEEERDILKKALDTLPKTPSGVPVYFRALPPAQCAHDVSVNPSQ